jgi:hypothetical protein
VCERIREKKIKPWSLMVHVFYFSCTDGITDKIFNIIIFNIVIGNSICKFKLVKRNNFHGL